MPGPGMSCEDTVLTRRELSLSEAVLFLNSGGFQPEAREKEEQWLTCRGKCLATDGKRNVLF